MHPPSHSCSPAAQMAEKVGVDRTCTLYVTVQEQQLPDTDEELRLIGWAPQCTSLCGQVRSPWENTSGVASVLGGRGHRCSLVGEGWGTGFGQGELQSSKNDLDSE